MFNSGRVRRNGFADSQLTTTQQRLKQATDARAQEMAGGTILYAGDAGMTDEQIAALRLKCIDRVTNTTGGRMRTQTRRSSTP